jgi:hypothetical protein
MAIAWAQVVISILGYMVNAHYTKVFLGYGAFKQLRDLVLILLAVMPMAFAMYLLLGLVHASQPIKLLIIGIVGCVTYLLTCRLICKETMYELLALVGFRTQLKQG